MTHDPERDAAAYLGGLMSRHKRRRFEAHIVDCEDCWAEVDAGRKGRALAESARELAPQQLRERVRTAVESLDPGTRRPRWVLATAVIGVAVIAAATYVVSRPDQPPVIAAVLTSFEEARDVGTSISPSHPRKLGHMSLVGTARREIGGVDVVIHRYSDPSGAELSIYEAEQQWPVAVGAEHDPASHTWTASIEGVVVLCATEPVPMLVVSESGRDVQMAAAALGLR